MRRVLLSITILALAPTAAAAAPAFGPPVDGLAIGLEVTDLARPKVAITIKNVSDHPIILRSHVATHETQLDWYTIDVSWPLAARVRDHARVLRGHGVRHPLMKVCTDRRGHRAITLTDDRDRSAVITVTLAAGKQLRHEVDLGDWPARTINGARPLGGGTYELAVTYTVTGETGVWNGTMTSGAVALPRRGRPANDMCERPSP